MATIIHNPIKNPRITEKASLQQGMNVYAFNVFPHANKTEIKKAIFALYKVKPVKVNIVSMKPKKVTFRGRPEVKGGGKYALVYLKAGDKIEFI